MTKASSQTKNGSAPAQEGITRITVSGYKSISQEQSIEIRPLTILAGTNSSGKSSMMQPLLLLKQTLEASYDPGALRLDGPNVSFTSANQFLSYKGKGKHVADFNVGVELNESALFTLFFEKQLNKALEVQRVVSSDEDGTYELRLNMTHDEILAVPLPSNIQSVVRDDGFAGSNYRWLVERRRCFYELIFALEQDDGTLELSGFDLPLQMQSLEPHIRQLIHLPGLRGNPERTYVMAAAGSTFPGTFENYTASVIAQWQAERANSKLEKLGQELNALGLTWKVTAEPINDVQVELRVGRLPKSSKTGASDMVSIADVGVGVSQTLPVLVALQVAKPGQLVYIEQPEIHLHPRAQTAMAQVLANAAKRGVRVVAETHSSLLILGIQTLVAEGKLAPELVKLHWFERRNGRTEITSKDLDEAGAFGDWPEDFADVMLEAENRYLNAAEAHLRVN